MWLRRFYACGVSMASPFLATLFEWLTPFLCFAFLAALFEWLKPFLWLRRFYGFAVSMASAFLCFAFLAALFEWLTPFQWLRRFSLRCFNGWRRLCAFGVSWFLWLTPFLASLFNFVEGFAVQWLKPFLGFSHPSLLSRGESRPY
ncbi:MAG: hypothetical protein IKK36_03485 [Bacteroidales bacterium]|nr:hypothetical protein [Bacteroidales bacterium]